MTKTYTCPKCGGSDYFMSNRNVMKGIGGIYGNRGGVKQFPVCKACDEIMDSPNALRKFKFSKRSNVLAVIGFAFVLLPSFIGSENAAIASLVLGYVVIVLVVISFIADYKKHKNQLL
jgi:hypothetical protein